MKILDYERMDEKENCGHEKIMSPCLALKNWLDEKMVSTLKVSHS